MGTSTSGYHQDEAKHPNGELYKRRLRDRYWQGRGRAI